MRCVSVIDYHWRIFVFLYELATIWETTLLIFPQFLGASPPDPHRGSAPGSRWGTSVPQTPWFAPSNPCCLMTPLHDWIRMLIVCSWARPVVTLACRWFSQSLPPLWLWYTSMSSSKENLVCCGYPTFVAKFAFVDQKKLFSVFYWTLTFWLINRHTFCYICTIFALFFPALFSYAALFRTGTALLIPAIACSLFSHLCLIKWNYTKWHTCYMYPHAA